MAIFNDLIDSLQNTNQLNEKSHAIMDVDDVTKDHVSNSFLGKMFLYPVNMYYIKINLMKNKPFLLMNFYRKTARKSKNVL